MRLPRLSTPSWLAPVLPWPLIVLRQRWASTMASAALLVGVLLSRLLVLPDGPWEQDESLLAAGVMSFDPSQHMPLPPGFPLWVVIGRLVRWLGASDPVLALQIASSAFSLLACWALIGLWEGALGRGLAVAASLLASFLPGVWFHAHRAFSETPSAALAIVALACWLRAGRAGFVPGAIAITCAALVRPPLAPFFLLLAVLAAWEVRNDLRLVARGAAAGALTLFVVLAPATIEAGGVGLLLDVTANHASEHAYLLGNEPLLLRTLGFARGLAGTVPALLLAAFATVGWAVLRRRLGRAFWPATAAAAWLLYLLVFLHNPTYTRYWVLAWLLATGPAVAGLAWLVRRSQVAVVLTLAATAVSALWTWPAIAHIHAHPLPVVAALRTVADEARGTLVFEDQLFSFRNEARLAGWLRAPSLRLGEMKRTKLGFGAAPIWFLGEGAGQDIDSPASQVVEVACDEPRVHDLAQGRFLQVRLVRNPVLVWRGGSYIEWEGTQRYMWCRRATTLLLPAIDEGGTVAFAAEIHHEIEKTTLVARVNDQETANLPLLAGRQVVRIPLPRPRDTRRPVTVDLELGHEVRPITDPRPMAIRLLRASVEAPPHPASPVVVLPEAASLLAGLARADGFYPPEIMGSPARAAAWTGPLAWIELPVAAGVVGVEMFAARPQPAEVEVRLGDATTRLRIGDTAAALELPVPAALSRGGLARLEIRSSTFVPGPGDQRSLGVAVSRVWYMPPTTTPGTRS